MKATYSPKYVLFLEFLSRLATFFCIVPSYDLKKRKLTYIILYRCYALVIVLGATSFSLASMYYNYWYGDFPVTIKTINAITDTAGIMLSVIIALGSSLWNMKTWDRLISHLSRLERPVSLDTKKQKDSSIWKNPFIFFILGTIFAIGFIIYQILISEVQQLFEHFNSISIYYVKFVMTTLAYTVTISIKSKYQCLNEMLLNVNAGVSTKENVKMVQKVRILSLEMDSIIETFNAYFGWPILFLIAHSFMQVLDCLSFFISKETTKFTSSFRLDFILFTYLISNIFVIFMLTTGCDNVLRVTCDIFKTCCDLKANIPLQSKEAEELDKLDTVIRKQSKFSAAGFFQINRSVLLSVSSAITTYMIVIIQFDSLK